MSTGIKISSTHSSNRPTDSTSPYNNNISVTTMSNGANSNQGVSVNPPKQKPRILKGWE